LQLTSVSQFIDINLICSTLTFFLDIATLSGALAVWLSSPQADFLSGRLIDARWDMEQVVAQKEEIVKGNWLKISVSGY
jgi:hypothetical protein